MKKETAKKKKGERLDPVLRESLKNYEEVSRTEKNRDRYEHRTYQICGDVSWLTKSQEEWNMVKSIGRIKQVRVPVERDKEGNDITPSLEEFLKKGSMRAPSSVCDRRNRKRHPVYRNDIRPDPYRRETGKH